MFNQLSSFVRSRGTALLTLCIFVKSASAFQLLPSNSMLLNTALRTAIPPQIFCLIRLETAMAEEERKQAYVFGDVNELSHSGKAQRKLRS